MRTPIEEFAVLEAFYSIGGEADLAEIYSFLESRRSRKKTAETPVDDGRATFHERVRSLISDLRLEGYLVRQKRGRYSLTHQGRQRFLNELARVAPESPLLMKKRGRKSVVVNVQVEALEEGGFLANCPAIQGCHAEGNTVAEALENLEDVARVILELRRQEDWPLPNGLEEFAPSRVLEAQLTVPLPE